MKPDSASAECKAHNGCRAGGHPDGKTGKCERHHQSGGQGCGRYIKFRPHDDGGLTCKNVPNDRSEEHTSELQSLMRNSYAVFCLKKKKNQTKNIKSQNNKKHQI